jgi:hypothetical protein
MEKKMEIRIYTQKNDQETNEKLKSLESRLECISEYDIPTILIWESDENNHIVIEDDENDLIEDEGYISETIQEIIEFGENPTIETIN